MTVELPEPQRVSLNARISKQRGTQRMRAKPSQHAPRALKCARGDDGMCEYNRLLPAIQADFTHQTTRAPMLFDDAYLVAAGPCESLR